MLIGLIMFGFTFYQSKQYEKQVRYQAQLDSIAAVENLLIAAEDSAANAAKPVPADSLSGETVPVQTNIYKDSLLEASARGQEEFYVLANDKVELTFSSKGAQPYSVKVKDYRNYDSTDLYIFRPGSSEMGYSIYAGELINTADFVFTLAERTDTSLVMRLPFSGGGYIEQSYSLKPGSYAVTNMLSFIGTENSIQKNVHAIDMDWSVTVPRMEKGYRNESTYSKLDYYFSGEKKPAEMGRGRNGSKHIATKLSWFAFNQQFFSAIMRSKGEFDQGDLSIAFFPEEDESRSLMTCQAKMRLEYTPNKCYENEFYFGPNHYSTLKSFGQKYEKIVPLGGWLVGWFTKYVIIPFFNFLHRSIANFGIIILIMTIFIKIVVLPFSFKSYSSSAKMQAIKPEIDKLNEKYPKQEDSMKKQQAQMTLYQRAGINPMGGCLPMLLQFPILWAMFRFFPASIELRQQGFLWADDLSAYDSIVDFGFKIPLIGDHLSLFALLMAVSMFFYSKFTTESQMSSNDPNTASMKFMSVYLMPAMMFFVCNSLSSGLSYYYLLSNLITMVETWVIRRYFIHPEEILAKLKASEGKPLPKSKWQQRLEEAQKMQQQALKEQQRKAGRR